VLDTRSAIQQSAAMPSVLVVHHTPSPAVHAMFEAVRSGATDDAIEGVDVVVRAALHATASDVLDADAYVLGTPANLGYISGALKHFFDQIYYPCLEETVGRPFGVYLHGNSDTTGAERAIDSITTGLRWQLAAKPVRVIGEPTKADLDACWDLGASIAAGLTL
jgi:multimeric flavodoxin WrbA